MNYRIIFIATASLCAVFPLVRTTSDRSRESEAQVEIVQLVEAETNPYYIRYNNLREAGLKELREWQQRDYLENHPKAQLIDNVCGRAKSQEEKQMCRKRGARMATLLLASFTKPLTAADAATYQKEFSKRPFSRATRITISHGKISSWEFMGIEENHDPRPSGFALARIQQLIRHGFLQQNTTVDFFLHPNDQCDRPNRLERKHPAIYFATTEKCRHLVPLTFSYLMQRNGWKVTRPFRPFEELKSKVVFRGEARNREHRYFFSLASVAGLLPFLDALSEPPKNPTHVSLCRSVVQNVIAAKPDIFQGTRYPYLDQCNQTDKKNIWRKDYLNYDDLVENKYLLLVDGSVGLFRLGPNLQAPGVVMLVNQTRSVMSFTLDLIPYVHYLPISDDLSTMGQEMNQTYHWAEKYKSVTKSIAAESTKWAALHTSDEAHQRDWILYHALLAEMRLPDSMDPGDYTSFANRTVDCDNWSSTARYHPFRPFQYSDKSLASLVHDIACKEMLDL